MSGPSIENWNKAVSYITEELLEKINLDPFQLKECDTAQLISLGPADVVVSSFPKSGSILVGEIVYNLLDHARKMDKSYGSVYHTHHIDSLPLFEWTTHDEAEEMSGTKLFTSNVRYDCLAQHLSGTKVIYVVRDPKHAAWELYNASFAKQMSFREFLHLFIGSEEEQSNPYHYKTHFLQFLNNEHRLDILILKFEDIDLNPAAALREIIDHLGLNVRLNSAQLAKIIGVTKEAEGQDLTTWGNLAKSIATGNFGSYFESDIHAMFDKELKVDWRLIKTGTV